ncbi:TRADD-N-associated membrane domain-containing protein [Streptomyces sp. TLI_185]|uniref:TRADD-N-associated membrane domain-containing protein n=1 Tax=Streptomyces sp. TLI_185 TaxID=2485151 RepID=UPI000F4ECE8B|nr:hypothetical protein [Streptomyces sp. TLI_185]RPF30312.1 hypothetical protein EDD92_0064 [Streptomyces sp. TLI_185]
MDNTEKMHGQERARSAAPRATAIPPVFMKVLVTAVAAAGTFLLTSVVNSNAEDIWQWVASITIGSAVLIVQALIDLGDRQEALARGEWRSEEKEAYQNLLEPDSLKILMDLNQRQVERYHEIVTRQARQSYRSAQFAMWAGVAMLAACLYVGLRYNAAEIKAFAAAMGAVSGAMTGYLSKTYLAVYRETLSQLNRFFDQPVTNGYFLAAERLAGDSMPEMRQRIVEQILLVSMRSGEQQSDLIPPSTGKRNGRRSKPAAGSENSAKLDGRA